MLKAGKAAVFKRYPFTLILKTAREVPPVKPVRIKLDPGSRTTGIAVVDDASGTVVFAAELIALADIAVVPYTGEESDTAPTGGNGARRKPKQPA